IARSSPSSSRASRAGSLPACFPALSVSHARSSSRVQKGYSPCCIAGRNEAVRAGRTITRIALTFEAGHDGFWRARWLAARGVEARMLDPTLGGRSTFGSRKILLRGRLCPATDPCNKVLPLPKGARNLLAQWLEQIIEQCSILGANVDLGRHTRHQ